MVTKAESQPGLPSHLLAQLGDLLPRMPPSRGYWLEALVPPHAGHSTGLLERPHCMAAGFPQSERSERDRGDRGGSRRAFDAQILKVTWSVPIVVC